MGRYIYRQYGGTHLDLRYDEQLDVGRGTGAEFVSYAHVQGFVIVPPKGLLMHLHASQ